MGKKKGKKKPEEQQALGAEGAASGSKMPKGAKATKVSKGKAKTSAKLAELDAVEEIEEDFEGAEDTFDVQSAETIADKKSDSGPMVTTKQKVIDLTDVTKPDAEIANSGTAADVAAAAAMGAGAGAAAAAANTQSQREALMEAVEAARESAEALRQAANLFSQTQGGAGAGSGREIPIIGAANGEAVHDAHLGAYNAFGEPNSFPKRGRKGRGLGFGQAPNDSELGAAYSPEAAAQAASHPSYGRSTASSRRSKNKQQAKSNRDKSKGMFSGRFSSKMTSSQPGFVDESVLMALPKFGDLPYPLPEPQEILDSLPSLNFGEVAQDNMQVAGMNAGGTGAIQGLQGIQGSQAGANSAFGTGAMQSVQQYAQMPNQVAGQTPNQQMQMQQGMHPSQMNVQQFPQGMTAQQQALYYQMQQMAGANNAQTMQQMGAMNNPNMGVGASAGMNASAQAMQQTQLPQQTMQAQYAQGMQYPQGVSPDAVMYGGMQPEEEPQGKRKRRWRKNKGEEAAPDAVPAEMYAAATAAMPHDENGMPYDYLYDGIGGYSEYDPYNYVPPIKATISLVLGVLSILLAIVPPLGVVLAVVSLLLGRSYRNKGGNLPRAATARICGLVGLVLSLLLLVIIGGFLIYVYAGLYGGTNASIVLGWFNTTPIGQMLMGK